MRTLNHASKLSLVDFGFALYWLAVVALFQGDIFFTDSSALGISSVDASRTTFMISITVVSITLLFLAIDQLISQTKRSYKTLALLGVIGFMLGLLATQLALLKILPVVVMLMASGILTGMGTGAFTTAWFNYLGTQSPTKTAQIIPLSFAFAYGAHFALSALHSNVALILTFIAPLISYFFFVNARAEESLLDRFVGDPGELKTKAYTQALSMLWLPVLTNAILAFCFGFMWQYLLDSNATVYQGRHESLIGQLIGALLIFILARYLRKYVNVDEILKRILVLFFVVFLLAPLVLNLQPSLMSSLIGLGYSLFDIVVWYLLAVCAFDTRTDGGILTGFARALTIGAMAIGSVSGISMQNMQLYNYQSARLIVLAFCVLYAIYVISRRFTKDRDLLDQFKNLFDYQGDKDLEIDEELEEPYTENLFEEVEKEDEENPYELKAVEYGLTRRETEIFAYLAQGRTAKFISDELFISNNTVRTHTQRIYDKLYIHSKQELIDLAQEWAEG